MSCPFLGVPLATPAGSAASQAQQGEVHTITALTSSMLSYGTYLKVDKLLELQELESTKHGKTAHDELLFIVIHQAYELWFKEILFEVDSLREQFMAKTIAERLMLQVCSWLNRIVEILKLLAQQISLLETMTPSGFMEFRDFLAPSSGFQSVQFRLLENKLGLKQKSRVQYHNASYTVALSPADRAKVEQAEQEPSLLDLVQTWLERTPGLEKDGFDFWTKYADGVRRYVQDLRTDAEATQDPLIKAQKLMECDKIESSFNSLLNADLHNEAVQRGERRFSHRAFQGALMINVYRDEPRFSLPFNILNLLTEVDSQLMRWRHNHVIMVQRMIGSKVGTGGSSGYQYLRATVSDRYKVFLDLFNLTTYLLPAKYIPALDEAILARLQIGQP